MKHINIIPELNYWFKRILRNSEVYDTYHKIPVDVSEYWRDPRSVIELLFNETFDPGELSSSSSAITIESKNDRPYIYLYRRMNILNLPDKILLNRIQVYRWWANVYGANSMKFIDLFDMSGSKMDPHFYSGNEVYMPFDVEEEDRSPYITYNSYNASTGNQPLWTSGDPDIEDNPQEDLPIIAPPDVFDFSDSTLDMLDKLWFYKTGCVYVNINDIVYEDLDSNIARLIYVYLDAMLNDSYIYYDGIEGISSTSDEALCCLYEKHVLDILYLVRQKSYGIIWRDSEVINNDIKIIEEDFFIMLKKKVLITKVTDEVLSDNKFILTGDQLPWNRRDFTFFKDGLILSQDEDFTITINTEDPNDVKAEVILLRDDFVLDELVKFIWSYANPRSPFSEPSD